MFRYKPKIRGECISLTPTNFMRISLYPLKEKFPKTAAQFILNILIDADSQNH